MATERLSAGKRTSRRLVEQPLADPKALLNGKCNTQCVNLAQDAKVLQTKSLLWLSVTVAY